MTSTMTECAIPLEDAFEAVQPAVGERLESLAKPRWVFVHWLRRERDRSEAAYVEAMIRWAWSLTAHAVRRQEEPERAKAYWECLVEAYEQMIAPAAFMDGRQPKSFRRVYGILKDHLEGARERYEEAQEEVECLKRGVPEGLFETRI